VSNIQFEQQKNRVVVEMEINSDIILGDSTVALLNGDILGTKFIQLDVGSIANPLKAKDTVRSQIAKGIADFLTEPVADLQSTLRKLNFILDNLGRNSNKLDEIFDGFKETPVLLNRTLRKANGTMDTVNHSISQVAVSAKRTLEKLEPTIANFKTFSDTLKSVQIGETLRKTQQSLTKLNETLGRLSKGDNTMSKLMTEDTLYVNLNKLLISLDSLSKHFNENPKHFMAPLGKSRRKIEKDLEEQRKKKNQ
jgi:phospholipid/cholesterol/gamma-HCH transport system substrate-binding protein